ncbi:hypothetical protein JCM10212_002014 [Sporobolomyces blumeae]
MASLNSAIAHGKRAGSIPSLVCLVRTLDHFNQAHQHGHENLVGYDEDVGMLRNTARAYNLDASRKTSLEKQVADVQHKMHTVYGRPWQKNARKLELDHDELYNPTEKSLARLTSRRRRFEAISRSRLGGS